MTASGLKRREAYDAGTFEIVLGAEYQGFDWRGMSGAAVFEGPNRVGVVQKAEETGPLRLLKPLPVARLFCRHDVMEAIKAAGLTVPLQRHRSDDYDIIGIEAFAASCRGAAWDGGWRRGRTRWYLQATPPRLSTVLTDDVAG
jgi:hypothetical protein